MSCTGLLRVADCLATEHVLRTTAALVLALQYWQPSWSVVKNHYEQVKPVSLPYWLMEITIQQLHCMGDISYEAPLLGP